MIIFDRRRRLPRSEPVRSIRREWSLQSIPAADASVRQPGVCCAYFLNLSVTRKLHKRRLLSRTTQHTCSSAIFNSNSTNKRRRTPNFTSNSMDTREVAVAAAAAAGGTPEDAIKLPLWSVFFHFFLWLRFYDIIIEWCFWHIEFK